MIDYTGKKLSAYIGTKLAGINASRDFVNAVVEYTNTPADTRVLGISGLRGTGKTTGMLQVINQIDDFDNVVYILLTKLDGQPDITYWELYEFIKQKHDDKKYIFIDEITYCKNFVAGSATLCDDLASSGKKVVVCGTDSYALVEARKDALYHRIAILNITFISYQESIRTIGVKNFKEYLELGGLYKEDRITDIKGLRDYIDTSVVDNIMHTLECNKDVVSLYNLEQYRNNSEKLRTVVYAILCSIVYSISNKDRHLSIEFITGLFNPSEFYDRRQLRDFISRELVIDCDILYNKKDVIPVLDVLERIHIVEKVPNIYDDSKNQYYITNPSVFNQLALHLVKTGEMVNIIKDGATIKGKHGFLFESIIVNHAIIQAKKYGYALYYYHDDNNKELDIVIGKKLDNDDFCSDDKYVLCEIKMTSDLDIASVQSTWINSTSLAIEGDIVAKYIIYSGKTTVFEAFANKDTYPPKNMTLKEIEEQNRGISLINVEDFINNMQNYLSILEQD